MREVKVWENGCNCSVLMTEVNPSQSSLDKAHIAWVAVKHSGDIVTCHCTCMAGKLWFGKCIILCMVYMTRLHACNMLGIR